MQENRLTELDLSGAGNVTQLYCYKNHLTQLDTSSMTAMTLLSCGYNPITALDLAANTALTELYCHDMQLESLDISALTNLQKVWCQNNRIKGHLDLTQDPNLLMVDTSGNRISSVDMYSSWYGETIHADNIGGGYVSITAESVLDNGAWTFPAVCVAEENEYVTFQYWLDNTTGEIVSTDAEFTVERGSVGNYTAVFQPIAEHLVFFMDRDGTMLSRQSVLHSGSAGQGVLQLLRLGRRRLYLSYRGHGTRCPVFAQYDNQRRELQRCCRDCGCSSRASRSDGAFAARL